MATFLDITLLEQFSSIVAFLFVFTVVYMIFQGTKLFTENKGLHAIIAFCIGLFVLFSSAARNIITVMSPWFVLMFIIIMFVLVGVKMLGISDKDITSAIMKKEYNYVIYFIVAFAVIIVMYALSQSFGQTAGPYLGSSIDNNATINTGQTVQGNGTGTATGDFNKNMAATIFHPKVLGLIFLLMVASFTIRLLAKSD